MNRLKALFVAAIAIALGVLAFGGSANAAGSIAGGDVIKNTSTGATFTVVEASGESARASDSAGTGPCFTSVRPVDAGATPWMNRRNGVKAWKYTCPKSVKLVNGQLSRAW